MRNLPFLFSIVLFLSACAEGGEDRAKMTDGGVEDTSTSEVTDARPSDARMDAMPDVGPDAACALRVCNPGEVETVEEECGSCPPLGKRTRSRVCGENCEWKAFFPWSACMNETVGECQVGAAESESQECGNCPVGERTRTRRCDSSCRWSFWSSWSSCSGHTCDGNYYCGGDRMCIKDGR